MTRYRCDLCGQTVTVHPAARDVVCAHRGTNHDAARPKAMTNIEAKENAT